MSWNYLSYWWKDKQAALCRWGSFPTISSGTVEESSCSLVATWLGMSTVSFQWSRLAGVGYMLSLQNLWLQGLHPRAEFAWERERLKMWVTSGRLGLLSRKTESPSFGEKHISHPPKYLKCVSAVFSCCLHWVSCSGWVAEGRCWPSIPAGALSSV